jgi:hypothetical protein
LSIYRSAQNVKKGRNNMRRYIGFTFAAALLAIPTLANADNLPLGSMGRDSPMDFIVHSQPAKFPHHIQPGTGAYASSIPQQGRALQPAPTAAELQWMDRASQGGEGK